MPYIAIRTTETLSRENKEALTTKLRSVWATCSLPENAALIQFTIEEGVFSDFHGNCHDPSAIVQINVAPSTPEEHYPKIVKGFYPVLVEYLKAPPNLIHITFQVINHWALNNNYVKV